MRKMTDWAMSESDTFELLNAIDERLATARLGQQQHDVLVRLRSLLEEDLDAYSGREITPLAEAVTGSGTIAV